MDSNATPRSKSSRSGERRRRQPLPTVVETPVPAKRQHTHRGRQRRFLLIVGGAAIAFVALAAAAVALLLWSPGEAVPEVSIAPPLTVAVLPFATPAAADAGTADAIARATSGGLQRLFRDVRVTPYERVQQYSGKAFDARTVGRELNVRYVIGGDVRPLEGTLEVTTELVDTSDGHLVRSEVVELPRLPESTPKAAPPGAANLADKLGTALVAAEMLRFGGPLPPTATPVEIALHAGAVVDQVPNRVEGLQAARKFYDDALRQEPHLEIALVHRADTLARELDINPRVDRAALIRELDDFTARAVAQDAKDARAWELRSRALMLLRRWNDASLAASEARKIDPDRSGPRSLDAEIMIETGRAGDALARLDAPEMADANAPGAARRLLLRCRALLALGRYRDAVAACEKSLVAGEESWMVHGYLVAANALAGDANQASAQRAKLDEFFPRFTIAEFRAVQKSDHPAYLSQVETHVYPGLRRAGVPDL